MKNIDINEEKIIAGIIKKDGQIECDENSLRVYWLIENKLSFIMNAPGGWDALYFDQDTESYWERIYLNSEYHGGGLPSLIKIKIEDAELKYNIKLKTK